MKTMNDNEVGMLYMTSGWDEENHMHVTRGVFGFCEICMGEGIGTECCEHNGEKIWLCHDCKDESEFPYASELLELSAVLHEEIAKGTL